jgi:hypothetical protein
MSQPNIIQSEAMPPQIVAGMPPGATSPMNAGLISQQQQTASHMALIGKSGGSKGRMTRRMTRRRFHGGTTPVVQVPPITAGAVNPQQTGAAYKDLTILAQNQSNYSTYDNAKTPGDTAAIQQQQQALYKGGSKKGKSKGKSKGERERERERKGKRGGSWPRWGCLSGGKKSKRTCKHYRCKGTTCKRKTKKTKKTRH